MFSELMLDISNLTESEAFFSFMDGLHRWARIEIERKGAQDLATAMSIADSLVELKKPDQGQKAGKAQGGGDKTHKGVHNFKNGRGKHQEGGWKGGNHNFNTHHSGKSGEHYARGPVRCFTCDGPHHVRDCPLKGRLAAEEKGGSETRGTEPARAWAHCKACVLFKLQQAEPTPRGREGSLLMFALATARCALLLTLVLPSKVGK